MNFRHVVATTACAVTLAGCLAPAEPVSTGPVKRLPPEVLAEFKAAGFADAIAEECRALGFNRSYEKRVDNSIFVRLEREGYTNRDLQAAANSYTDSAAQKDFFSYVEARNILINDRGTWCAAGFAEMREDTRIGRYLVRK